MKVIGITGGVGCGKSTVLKYIKDNYNVKVIYADDVAKELMSKDNIAYQRIVEIFGDDILQSDLEIDRKKLSLVVFNNPNKLSVLNSIVHPLVKKYIIEDIVKEKCLERYDYVFVEAALLIEDHYDIICDELWYVYADINSRIERLADSRGYSVEKTQSIMRNQLSEEEFKRHCHKVIDNSFDFSKTALIIDEMMM